MGTTRERTLKKLEALKAQLAAMDAREKAEIRKKDTRRKVILGGALLELARTDTAAQKMVQSLITGLSRPHDVKAFDGWGKEKA